MRTSPRKYEKKVLWSFKLACEGHGRDVREALTSAINRLQYQLKNDWSEADLLAIEDHELVMVDDGEVEES